MLRVAALRLLCRRAEPVLDAAVLEAAERYRAAYDADELELSREASRRWAEELAAAHDALLAAVRARRGGT